MVRAILEGRKTQTRRIVKIQPENTCPVKGWIRWRGLNWAPGEIARECPYGQPGDRLWVRETWRMIYEPYRKDCKFAVNYKAGGFRDTNPRAPLQCPGMVYGAAFDSHKEGNVEVWPWKPSIHMPRWASRITLEITGIEVKPLWRMAVNDMIAEGVPEIPDTDDAPAAHPLTPFIRLWDSINAGRGYSFQSNPWVWVINFKRIESEAN